MTNKNQRATKNNQPASPSRRSLLWIGIIGVALIASAIVLSILQGQPATVEDIPEVTGGPSAAIDQTVFDYGDVKLGTTVKTVFRIKNVGNAQLAFRGAPRVEVLEGC
jgi:hypothetical protein